MAVRTPLYWDGTSIREMSAAQITEVVHRAVYEYGQTPSVALEVLATDTGNMLGMTDTRYQAGTFVTRTSAQGGFASEAETPDISLVVTATQDKLNLTGVLGNTNELADTNSRAFPVYWDGSDIRSMTYVDFVDTFCDPAIDYLVNWTSGTPLPAGTYFIDDTNSIPSGDVTLVSSTPVFTDTRANAAAYQAASIPEAQDQPITVANYYLWQYTPSSVPTMSAIPLQLTTNIGGDDIQLRTYSEATFASMLGDTVATLAFGDGFDITDKKIRYAINHPTGTNRGTGILNTVLNGTSAAGYRQRFVSVNDYRTQEFPNGSAVAANTWFLKIYKETT